MHSESTISPASFRLTDFLPTTKKELEIRGWEDVDVVLFSGDAYVDHPSFGAALVGRMLEAQGLRVALVPQPDWRGDHRDFTKMGRPRLFFGVTAGNMDSMVNHYTAGKRLRSDDAYTADGKAGARPDYATKVYTRILRELYPDVPILLGGIEASMRRLTHYDYWSDSLQPGILAACDADLLVYGMGELPLTELCNRIRTLTNDPTFSLRDKTLNRSDFDALKTIPQTASIQLPGVELPACIRLHAHEACLSDKQKQAENFRHIEEESNKLHANTLVQSVFGKELVVNPPFPPMTTEELDRSFDYPYTRYPHPKYKGKTIPAYEMIKFSVNIHRGCFGGCAFCTISAHQGKFVMNRSTESIVREVKTLTQRDDFKGYLSDLGGPSANMYQMAGKDLNRCAGCVRPSCIHPRICSNLNTDHSPLLNLYKTVDAIPGIKKSFIGSGIRYDLLVNSKPDSAIYLREVLKHHVSGRLKVAPEHTSESVLSLMRKPSFDSFIEFNRLFEMLEDERASAADRASSVERASGRANRASAADRGMIASKPPQKASGRQQLIPYFISSHPGCTEKDMAQLASITRKLNFKLEQIQDFTPTPMTLATEIYYTGIHPYTLKPIFTAKTKFEKEKQRSYFFWYNK